LSCKNCYCCKLCFLADVVIAVVDVDGGGGVDVIEFVRAWIESAIVAESSEMDCLVIIVIVVVGGGVVDNVVIVVDEVVDVVVVVVFVFA
jgi:hypothetical protein